jgi:hypothetical protein
LTAELELLSRLSRSHPAATLAQLIELNTRFLDERRWTTCDLLDWMRISAIVGMSVLPVPRPARAT